jgi:sugar lactone lactonase YvrE
MKDGVGCRPTPSPPGGPEPFTSSVRQLRGHAASGIESPRRAEHLLHVRGPGLHWLHVTSATQDWSDDDRRAEPAAGLVYQLDTDAPGRPAEKFRPDPDWWEAIK